jgi:DNA repair protein RecO (recombination protein O)
MGENDRLLTILTPENGLIKAIAPGSRKINSSLGGRSNLFVTNQLLIARGKSIDKIIQAETIITYPHLTSSLGQLAISQYLGELVLSQSLNGHPQPEIYQILHHHLQLIEELRVTSTENLLKHLNQGILQILILAGISPQINHCCVSKKSISAEELINSISIPFSIDNGGILTPDIMNIDPTVKISHKISPLELYLLQSLQDLSPETNPFKQIITSTELEKGWRRIEHLFRDYIYYHLGINIRSASLITSL